MRGKWTWSLLLVAFFAFVFFQVPPIAAKLLWGDSAAPWERVYGFYYPNANDGSLRVVNSDFRDVDSCVEWINREAEIYHGSLEKEADQLKSCGVGCRIVSGATYSSGNNVHSCRYEIYWDTGPAWENGTVDY